VESAVSDCLIVVEVMHIVVILYTNIKVDCIDL